MISRVQEYFFGTRTSTTLTMEGLTAKLLNSNRTKSGISVGVQDMVSFAPLWNGVQMIAQDVAKCPLYIFKRLPTGRERATDHKAFSFVADYPNERQGAVEFWQQFMIHKLLYSRAFIWIDKANDGAIKGLYHLLPDRTYFDNEQGVYVSQLGGKAFDFFPSEILDIKSPSSPFIDCSLATTARESIAVGLAAQDHSSSFLSSDCQPGGILEIPAGFTKQAKDNLERGVRSKLKGDPFKTLVLGDGAKWHDVQIDAEKSQLTETKLHSAREACMWLNTAPSRIGLPDSGGYGSRTEDNLDYKDTTIYPHLNSIRSECGLKLSTDKEKRTRSHYFEHNTDKLYTLNPETRANVGKTEIEMGTLSPNEYRRSVNRNDREGGDAYYEPNSNFTTSNDESEAVETARSVLKSKSFEWFEKTLGKIKRESQKKDAIRFCTWFDSFVPDDYGTYFDKSITLGITETRQQQHFERVRNGINQLLDETQPEDLPVVVTEYCENIKSSLEGAFKCEV